MPRVDLVYDTECPNVSAARDNLRGAFARSGLSPVWQEHRIGDPETPGEVQGFGSPSILVDGRDVAQVEPSSDLCCRIYTEHGTTAGAPSIETITTALAAAFGSPREESRSGSPIGA